VKSASRWVRVVRGRAWAYALALVLVALGMRFVGERWFLTTLCLYLPRLGWILPWPLVVLLLFVVGQRRLGIAFTIVVPLFVVFVLMGYRVGAVHHAPQTLRLMTWNTFFGRNGNDDIYEDVLLEQPDVFVSQATGQRTRDTFRLRPAGYQLSNDGEFLIASKLPIIDKEVPPMIDHDHPSAWVRYTLQSKDGPIDVFVMHPRSPRDGVEEARGSGFRSRLHDLGLLGESIDHVAKNTTLRRRQVESLCEGVRRAKNPVLIAGDTNLPTLSWLYHRTLGALDVKEAFDEAGAGFGYTFPAKVPWMRIDRVLASAPFQVLRVRDGGKLESDHRYVVVDLARQ